ncbi:MAG TPA: hypothetical protein PKD85_00440 [Saprospiraceae bacterium]|nr:hypothetical protein [Saprospiraceae bacterium]
MEEHFSDSSKLEGTLENLNRAWSCVLSQYRGLAKENSLKGRKGINVFKMMTKQPNKEANCEYYFAPSEMWNIFLDCCPNRDSFLDIFDSNTMYSIMVSVPLPGIEIETLQTIKIFKIENDEEIEF